jgi:hypothetical protein
MALRDRSTTDLLVLMLAGTICLTVMGASLAVIIGGFVNPEDEHTGGVAVVADTLQMLISLLAGFLAGRTDTQQNLKLPPQPEREDPNRDEKP